MTTEKLAELSTEARNPATADLDRLPTAELIALMHQADREAEAAVESQTEQIAKAVDVIVVRLEQGGRLFYSGAGTSGRLGVLDASECPPTYNVPPELVQGIIAGGDMALRRSIERAEDDPEQGKADLRARSFSSKDVIVGIAASGRTPYVLGALELGRELGALTIGLSCVANSPVARASEIAITPVTGAEVVTGSTRMKAGTATKLVLNMLSTATMVKLGYVYGNLMINVQPTNDKLRDRAGRIIATITGLDQQQSLAALEQGGSVRTAIVMEKLKVDREEAEAKLRLVGGRLRQLIKEK